MASSVVHARIVEAAVENFIALFAVESVVAGAFEVVCVNFGAFRVSGTHIHVADFAFAFRCHTAIFKLFLSLILSSDLIF